MDLYLYKTDSPRNKIVKEINQEFYWRFSGFSVDSMDVLNPVLDICFSNQELLTPDNYTDLLYSFNYAYIEALNRYYFIEGISLLPIRQGIQIRLKCDLLMTYREYLKKLNLPIARYEHSPEKYLPDNNYIMDSYKTRLIRYAESTTDETFKDVGMLDKSYVLTVVGGKTE